MYQDNQIGFFFFTPSKCQPDKEGTESTKKPGQLLQLAECGE